MGSGGSLSLTGASVTLDQANNFGNRWVSLAVDGPGNATLRTTAALTLADVTLGTGQLSLTAGGSIRQISNLQQLRTEGNVTLTVDAATNAQVSLTGDNRIGGTVTIAEANGGRPAL